MHTRFALSLAGGMGIRPSFAQRKNPPGPRETLGFLADESAGDEESKGPRYSFFLASLSEAFLSWSAS